MVTCRNKALEKEQGFKQFKLFCKYRSVLMCSGEKVFQKPRNVTISFEKKYKFLSTYKVEMALIK